MAELLIPLHNGSDLRTARRIDAWVRRHGTVEYGEFGTSMPEPDYYFVGQWGFETSTSAFPELAGEYDTAHCYFNLDVVHKDLMAEQFETQEMVAAIGWTVDHFLLLEPPESTPSHYILLGYLACDLAEEMRTVIVVWSNLQLRHIVYDVATFRQRMRSESYRFYIM